MIEAVLFDCGGVLTYPKGGWWPRPVDLNEILGGRKLVYDMDRANEAMKKHAHFVDEGQLISGLKHEMALRYQFLSHMNEDLGAGVSESELQKMVESLTYNDKRYALYDDTKEGLKRFAGEFRIGFISNAMPSMVRALINAGICDDLDCFTVSCLVGCQKPDKEIYLLALNELGLEAEKCVFVDDLRDNILGAASVGMNVIRMARPFYYAEPSPDFEWNGATAHDLSEVYDLVKACNAGEIELKCSE